MRSVQTTVTMALIASLVGSAHADGRGVLLRGGSPVKIKVRGTLEKGMRLSHQPAGWGLALDMPNDGAVCAAELKDVTPLPTGLLKWTERVPNDSTSVKLLLPVDRYFPGHAYKLTVRCGARELLRGYVYLAPAAGGKGKSHVELSDAEAAADLDHPSSDEILSVPKGSL